MLSIYDTRKEVNHPEVGLLVFENSTFQIYDTLDLKAVLYTPLEEEDTPRKLEYLIQAREDRYQS